MREIKFRAWDNHGKFMTPIMYLRDLTAGFILESPTREVMQFTGLRDNRGREIYEGDILKKLDQHVYPMAYYYAVVEFIHGIFRAESKDKSTNCYPEGMESMEIVGNIYENPELLKEN